VVLSPDEIEEAYPRTTQTIEIEAFVDVDEVPFVYLEKPYYTAPINKGEKVYALLREALRDTGKAALGRVVIRSKQHLAVVLPCGPALVLNLVRWGGEIRSWEGLQLPPLGKAAGLRDAEMKMARQLIADMSGHWSAQEFRDEFHDAVLKLVDAKVKAGEGAIVEPLEEAPDAPGGADVIDLTELLRRSLRGGAAGGKAAPAKSAPARAAAKKTAKAAPHKERAAAASTPRKSAAKTTKTARAKRAA
jgi:DNA end-binding protein Ku